MGTRDELPERHTQTAQNASTSLLTTSVRMARSARGRYVLPRRKRRHERYGANFHAGTAPRQRYQGLIDFGSLLACLRIGSVVA